MSCNGGGSHLHPREHILLLAIFLRSIPRRVSLTSSTPKKTIRSDWIIYRRSAINGKLPANWFRRYPGIIFAELGENYAREITSVF